MAIINDASLRPINSIKSCDYTKCRTSSLSSSISRSQLCSQRYNNTQNARRFNQLILLWNIHYTSGCCKPKRTCVPPQLSQLLYTQKSWYHFEDLTPRPMPLGLGLVGVFIQCAKPEDVPEDIAVASNVLCIVPNGNCEWLYSVQSGGNFDAL